MSEGGTYTTGEGELPPRQLVEVERVALLNPGGTVPARQDLGRERDKTKEKAGRILCSL